MKHNFRQALSCAFAIASIAAASPSFAVVAAETSTTMTGNGVSVTEYSGANYSGYLGSYSVTNNSDSAILRFQVSTGTSNTSHSTVREGWYSDYLSKELWVSYYGELYGSFESFFGTVDTGVFDYHQGESGQAIQAGETTGQEFLFNAPLASEFIAFDGKENIIARSLNVQANQVPEPGSLALLGLGIAGLSIARRKRNS